MLFMVYYTLFLCKEDHLATTWVDLNKLLPMFDRETNKKNNSWMY